MGIYYSAAAFWKLNSSFLSVRHSCAPIFLLQLIAHAEPDALPIPDLLASLLGMSAPLVVIGGELAIALLLLQRSSVDLTKLGVLLALCLHMGIAVCPPPNNVAIFSVMCASRLNLFLPTGVPAALSELGAMLCDPKLLASAVGAYYAVSAGAVAIAAQLASHPDFMDWAYPVYIAQCAVLCRAVVLEPSASPPPTALPSQRPGSLASHAAEKGSRRVVLFITVFYAYCCIPLGIHDQGQPHMYANLRLHGGSNHYLVPTSVLHQLFEHADPRNSWFGDFAGGVVRIEATTSDGLNAAYPAEYTEQLSTRTRQLLQLANHTGRQWNPMLTLVASSPCAWDPASGTPFGKYTLPALELRRFLHVLREKGEAFELTYTRLPAAGDAAIRATSEGSATVTLKEDGKGGQSCSVRGPLGLLNKGCADDEVALMPPPSFLARKLIIFEPYPVVIGDDDEVHCFGP